VDWHGSYISQPGAGLDCCSRHSLHPPTPTPPPPTPDYPPRLASIPRFPLNIRMNKAFECAGDCLPNGNICSHIFTPGCQLLRHDDPPHSPTSTIQSQPQSQSPPHRSPRALPAVVVEYSDDPLDNDAHMMAGPSNTPPMYSSSDVEMSFAQMQQPGSSRQKSSSGSPSASDVAGPPTNSNPDDDIIAGPDIAMKLYRILEEGTFKAIVSWAPKGDRFIIHDAAEFTKAVLPKLFRHSNFSSFVRQLNKYDFHKVRSRVLLVYAHVLIVLLGEKRRRIDEEGLYLDVQTSTFPRGPSVRTWEDCAKGDRPRVEEDAIPASRREPKHIARRPTIYLHTRGFSWRIAHRRLTHTSAKRGAVARSRR
jgi:hypothetical protein